MQAVPLANASMCQKCSGYKGEHYENCPTQKGLVEGSSVNVKPLRDNVNHPSHYTEGRKYEPIDVIEDWGLGYHLGSALKYLSRAGRKGDEREDLAKAMWFINRRISQLEVVKDGKK